MAPKKKISKKRRYPWTPGDDEKTVVQSFALYRSGILPVIEKDAEGEAHYTLLDVFTKPGFKRYEAESRRAITAKQKGA